MPVRVGVIDSGVHAGHPHVGGVAGGVAIAPDGSEDADYTDLLGHGTAVTAVIREKAPEAELFAVRIFHRTLSAPIAPLVQAVDWCLARGMHLIKLEPRHQQPGARAGSSRLSRSRPRRGCHPSGRPRKCWRALAARQSPRRPASGPGLGLPAREFRTTELPDGRTLYRASGFPRPIPGLPPSGISRASASPSPTLPVCWLAPGQSEPG